MASHSTAFIPLTDVFPWSEDDPSTILVVDSMESDGRFILYQLATQFLTNKERRVLWLSGSATTNRLIANGLKKMGCDEAASLLKNLYVVTNKTSSTASSRLTIRALTEELGAALLSLNEREAESSFIFDNESFVRNYFGLVKTWASQATAQSQSIPWVLIDDVSTLANILGQRLVSGFLQSAQALANNLQFGLVIRCSNEGWIGADATLASSSWIGMSGCSSRPSSSSDALFVEEECSRWTCFLFELADIVVDVCPLTSGPTRDAHGRLIFTVVDQAKVSLFNYCLTDNKALAIRIQR